MPATILVIEDNIESRDAVTIWLERAGYSVIVANDGSEGLSRAVDSKPDLIITDLVMPKLNGIETIKFLRSIPSLERSLPIIAATSRGMELAEQAMNAGADKIIGKPYDAEILLAVVKSLLRAKTLASS